MASVNGWEWDPLCFVKGHFRLQVKGPVEVDHLLGHLRA